MAEFKPFDLNYGILASIPKDRPNIVLSAQTYIKLKNSFAPPTVQTNDKKESSTNNRASSNIESE